MALQPENPAIIDSMGWVLFNLGDYEAALIAEFDSYLPELPPWKLTEER